MTFIPSSRLATAPSPSAWCFAFVQRDLLLPDTDASSDKPSLHPLAETTALDDMASARHYLGRLGPHDCWALQLPDAPPGWRRTPLRMAMLAMDAAMAGLAGRAAQVLEWDRSHRFCGVCGTPTELHAAERARVCPACKHSAYPRVSPAMMALVWRPGELLLARAVTFTTNMYSALAGFVEAGESLEECVHREVAEEVSVSVDDLRYYSSQSWPFPHSLMVAFTARWTAGEIVPQPGEIADAQWFAIDALPPIPPRFSIAGHLIRDAVARMQAGSLI